MLRRGFFGTTPLQTVQPAALREPGCAACGLYKTCLTPKMPVAGRGGRRILVVGEAPGRHEDYQGRPFVGESGELLREAVRAAGGSLTEDCWVTNALRCRPPGNKIPKPDKMIAWCRPYLMRALEELKPDVVLLLGGVPIKSLIGWLWKEDAGGVMRWAGWRVPSARLNCWVCPTFHPSFILRGGTKRGPDPVEALFRQHVAAAWALGGRPYDPAPPEYRRLVKVTMDAAEAADEVHRMIDYGRPVAFDYETDRKKPDHPDASVVACAVSDGRISVAFPWHGKAVDAVGELLRSPCKKIGHNIAFEERWTRRTFGHGVSNWAADGMLMAHVLDNRRGTKSLKFQSFVRLGVDSYDDAVKPYLKAKGGNAPNRIRELDLGTLLGYCALDALYEYRLGHLMARELGREL